MGGRSGLIWLATGVLALASPGVAAPAATPAAPAGTAAATGVGLMGPALASADLARSLRFYRDGLGLTVARTLDLADATQVILSFGPEPRPPFLFLLQRKKPVPVSAGGALQKIVLTVPSAADVAARLKAAGYEPGEIKAKSANNVKIFWVKDPDGNAIEITEHARGR